MCRDLDPEKVKAQAWTAEEGIPAGRYRHHLGGLYDVIGVGAEADTLAPLVTMRSVATGWTWSYGREAFFARFTVARPVSDRADGIEEIAAVLARVADVVARLVPPEYKATGRALEATRALLAAPEEANAREVDDAETAAQFAESTVERLDGGEELLPKVAAALAVASAVSITRAALAISTYEFEVATAYAVEAAQLAARAEAKAGG